MGVSSPVRGLKAGEYLLAATIAKAHELGAAPLYLLTNHTCEAAIHLYEKFGFERCGTTPHAFKLKDGTYRDEIMMVKML